LLRGIVHCIVGVDSLASSINIIATKSDIVPSDSLVNTLMTYVKLNENNYVSKHFSKERDHSVGAGIGFLHPNCWRFSGPRIYYSVIFLMVEL
jgi:hypothetical protein